MSVINISPEGRCCGCNACTAVCPKSCISMRTDRHGALQSVVDASLCIECGRCEAVCPAIEPLRDAAEPRAAYAAWSRDAGILQGCASAGAASTLSRWMIRQGGVVYGCSADGLDVRHVRVDSEDDLAALQGSKYVHSDMSAALPALLDDLRQGRRVLFIGTPCQAEAAKRLAGKRWRQQLLTLDLICHGVPTQQMLRDHARRVAHAASIRQVQFRQGTEYSFTLTDAAGTRHGSKGLWEDRYSRAFICGWSLRQNCHQCPWGARKRAGDITIGDFWGLSPQVQRPEGARGTSLILPNTDAGADALRECLPQLQVQERSVAEALAGNPHLNAPLAANRTSRLFMRLYPWLPFDVAVYICCIPSKTRTLLRRLRR